MKVQATVLEHYMTMNDQGHYRREFEWRNNTKRKRKRGREGEDAFKWTGDRRISTERGKRHLAPAK